MHKRPYIIAFTSSPHVTNPLFLLSTISSATSQQSLCPPTDPSQSNLLSGQLKYTTRSLKSWYLGMLNVTAAGTARGSMRPRES
ncbi:hypothetical protein AGABI2DRAFT_195183 [Agaricus bisporus var. bisporus H97]|uniref:hypothetical protein n=1 Tax=Agaricus bisporus var. bisporus (strain H97 / ATCC MYA-4626 / FGSC 10389) TaxID=936046 RepID=UPI00029F75D6|nr:hypothetical protein AGABI2DRAFT_195183 [Agaricus bisporus var. bisporus H97]EKV43632.1 hypothetical protein AGABI2DRAFT_195183 [Agaricus bisporus var. bisporus H97]